MTGPNSVLYGNVYLFRGKVLKRPVLRISNFGATFTIFPVIYGFLPNRSRSQLRSCKSRSLGISYRKHQVRYLANGHCSPSRPPPKIGVTPGKAENPQLPGPSKGLRGYLKIFGHGQFLDQNTPFTPLSASKTAPFRPFPDLPASQKPDIRAFRQIPTLVDIFWGFVWPKIF